jgi:DNA-binding SARP family transcriptional activator
MTSLTVRLFGRFALCHGTDDILDLHAGKLKELFCYLLLQRGKAHSRESLATLFWGDCTTAQSRKNLRQALWHLQSTLNVGQTLERSQILQVDQDSVGVHPQSSLWLDVAEFETASLKAQKIPGSQLDDERATALEEAVQLYRGDLLEGCYQDWCLFERERLQNLYLAMLDKLMSYCEKRRLYQTGLEYGERILRMDRAHERTHQRILRFYYLSGDRAGALRQFQRCVKALSEELQVEPAQRTLELYEQVRADHLDVMPASSDIMDTSENKAEIQGRLSISEILNHLRKFKTALASVQGQVQREIETLEESLTPSPRSSRRRENGSACSSPARANSSSGGPVQVDRRFPSFPTSD